MSDQATAGKVVVNQKGEGGATWMLGGLYETRISTAESGGAAAVVEFTVPVGMGPPQHFHEQDEIVYVAEGTAKFHLNGETTELGPGSVVYIPKGAQETFEPTSTLRLVTVYVPGGGMDEFFSEAGEPAARREIPPPPAAPPDVERLARLGAKAGLTLIPPDGH